jgi:hypothetical protein
MVFPVEDIISLSVYVNSFYTSENNTLFHEYVFDRVLPLRNSDILLLNGVMLSGRVYYLICIAGFYIYLQSIYVVFIVIMMK